MKRNYRLFRPQGVFSQLFIIVTIVALILLMRHYGAEKLEIIRATLQENYIFRALWNACREVVQEVLLNPVIYLMVLGILALERWMPADRAQKPFSPGFWQDFLWCIGDFFIQALLLIPFFMALRTVHGQFLSAFTINLPALFHLPSIIILALAILITDFSAWLAHMLQHKIPFLWRFHAVHHSQREMNLFTDTRFHFGDALISYPLQIFPLYWLLIPLPHGIYYIFFRTWYPRLYHANLRTHFGFLRYVLVTPQSHRIHHSIEAKHFDHNFGVIFSVWDRIFHTHYQGDREYPDTGIHDQRFPAENHLRIWQLPRNYISQLLYPFHWQRR